MNSRFNSNNFVSKRENSLENSPENSADSPSSAMAKDSKIAAATSPSKTRRGGIEKRVVSVPIKDVERFKLKGDQISAPPSDSWAWRKYGQKPIKGSPYPRAYYKCSSSKGCPARKQVERSRMDPNMLIVTYSCEHNHPLPDSRNNHHRASASAASAAATNTTTISTTPSVSEEELEEEVDELEEEKPINQVSNQSHDHEVNISENKFSKIGEGNLDKAGEFGWLTDFESTSCTMLESPISMEDRITTDKEMAMIFTMREEEESDLFADLGELPECSTVFRREMAQIEVERRRHSLATTG